MVQLKLSSVQMKNCLKAYDDTNSFMHLSGELVTFKVIGRFCRCRESAAWNW